MGYTKVETVINPVDLLADKARALRLLWWMARLHSRCEKATASLLKEMGMNFFLPVLDILKISTKGRKNVYQLPLYPGYIFIAGEKDIESRSRLFKYVTNILPVANNGDLVNRLSMVWKLIKSERSMHAENDTPRGQVVRVGSGPLDGIEGTLVNDRQTGKRLIAPLFLGQDHVLIDLEPTDIVVGI